MPGSNSGSMTSKGAPFNPTAPAFNPPPSSQQMPPMQQNMQMGPPRHGQQSQKEQHAPPPRLRTDAPLFQPSAGGTASGGPSSLQSQKLYASSKEFKPSFQPSKPPTSSMPSASSQPGGISSQTHSQQKFKFVNSKPFFPLSENQSSLFSQISKDHHGQKNTMKSLFVNENLRYFLLEKSLFRYQILHPQFVQFYFPMEVRTHALSYHSIFPLFQKYENSRVFPNHELGVFKALQSTSNTMVALVRVQEASSQSANILRNYKMLNHPNVVKLKHHFYSNQFVQQTDAQNEGSDGMGGTKPVQVSGAPSVGSSGTALGSGPKKELIIVYEYVDYCESMYQLYIAQRILALPKEKDLWSFLCQIFSALDSIHSKGLWYGGINLRKLLVSPQMKRVQLNQIGLAAMFAEYNNNVSLERRQSEDIRAVAHVIVQLALGSGEEIRDFDASLYELRGKYSDELVNFLDRLMSETLTAKEAIEQNLGYHMMNEMVAMNRQANTIEHELSKELENGRLFRLLVKLNTIMQRMNHDPHPHRWNEEGDLYILRLFFDHLFNKRNKDESHVDWVHVIENLNKLDVGSSESVLLASKNEQNILMLSYREIREIFVTQQWQV